MYIAFLDEFGHIGPFVSRQHPKYNQSPVFGLAGYLLPHERVRDFAIWFYQQKNALFENEIKNSNQHPATWEKKGSSVFTTENVTKHINVRGIANRAINKISKLDGRLFFYGRQKYLPPDQSNAIGLYTTVMAHSIRQIDKFCETNSMKFLIILDQHDDRVKLLEAASKTMFGDQAARNLLEPPFQAESHLYQTLQAADWLAALIARVWAYRLVSTEYSDW